MRRRLLNLLTAVSLLLCVAAVALWVRSYRVGDWTIYLREGDPDDVLAGRLYASLTEWSVYSTKGRVEISWISYTPGNGIQANRGVFEGWQREECDPDQWGIGPPPDNRFGFAWRYEEYLRPYDNGMAVVANLPLRHRLIAGPHWLAALLLAVPPGRFVYKRLRRDAKPGHCRRCGYDLRATPGLCPECGRVPDVMAAEAS
jgi:hypothetical protein